MKFLVLFLAILSISASAFGAPAGSNSNLSNPKTIQGRWEFVITTGDGTAQSSFYPTTFSVFVTQANSNGGAISSVQTIGTDTSLCDGVSSNNVQVSGSFSNPTLAMTASVLGNPGGSFTYTFSGTLNNSVAVNLPGIGMYTIAQISGTYSASGSCQAGVSSGTPASLNATGKFIATYYPLLGTTFAGALEPDNSAGGAANITVSNLSLNQNAAGLLSGSIKTNSPCFANGSLTISAGTFPNLSYAAGSVFEVYATDANGTLLWLVGLDTTDYNNALTPSGTNTSYTAYYMITGGPCDGQGGFDAPFKPVTAVKIPILHPIRGIGTRFQQ